MKNQLTRHHRIMWLLFLILPGKVHAGYLKSTGNIKVLEGETCYLHWDAYSKEAGVAPCSWWYAHNKTEDPSLFLAYEDGKRYDFGGHSQWKFTNVQQPCSGDLQKNVKLEDAGVYSMQTEKGVLQKTDSEISMEVFKSSDLSFLVSVNGKVSNLDLSERIWTLELLKTHSPVNVSVVLSKNFPPTTVITISNGEEVSCDNPYKECHQLTDLSETTDVSISIKIETEIIGATQILIIQPLAYSAIRARNVYAALFFVLLVTDVIIIIIIIIWFVRNKRLAYKQTDLEGEVNQGVRFSLKQHLKNMKSDIAEAFRVNKEPGYDEVVNIVRQQGIVINELEKELSKDNEMISSEIKQCNDIIDNTLSSTNGLLQKCQETLKKMADTKTQMETVANSSDLNTEQHEQYEVMKLQMKLVTEIEKRLNCISNCCNSFKMTKILQMEARSKDQKPEAELEEVTTEKTGIINETGNKLLEDILEKNEEIMGLKCEQVKLKELLKEIQMISSCIKGKSNIIADAEKQISDIREHFDKIQKGWEYSRGSSIDAVDEQRDQTKDKEDRKASGKKKKMLDGTKKWWKRH